MGGWARRGVASRHGGAEEPTDSDPPARNEGFNFNQNRATSIDGSGVCFETKRLRGPTSFLDRGGGERAGGRWTRTSPGMDTACCRNCEFLTSAVAKAVVPHFMAPITKAGGGMVAAGTGAAVPVVCRSLARPIFCFLRSVSRSALSAGGEEERREREREKRERRTDHRKSKRGEGAGRGGGGR